MILSKPDITKELEEGKLRIEPRPEKIAQVSVNLRLGHVFTTFKKLKPHYPVVEITDSLLEEDALWDSRELPHYDLEPQGFVLAQTYETVTIPNTMMGLVEGRSSWARMGINVQAAPKIDPGFSATITLEIANFGNANIRLVAEKHEPAQLLLAYLNTPIPLGEEYGALKEDRFQFQVTPTGRKRK